MVEHSPKFLGSKGKATIISGQRSLSTKDHWTLVILVSADSWPQPSFGFAFNLLHLLHCLSGLEVHSRPDQLWRPCDWWLGSSLSNEHPWRLLQAWSAWWRILLQREQNLPSAAHSYWPSCTWISRKKEVGGGWVWGIGGGGQDGEWNWIIFVSYTVFTYCIKI